LTVKENLRRAGKVVAFMLIFFALASGVVWLLNQLAADDDESARQHAEIVALQAGLDEANARLEAEGEQPVPVPSVEPADPGSAPVVEPIPVSPTNAQLDAALERYCDTHDCLPGPTNTQVRAALTDLCSEIRCRGADGKDSTAPGPAPTTAQLDAAQARYCDAHNECRGPGGANGADGRGILSMQCAVGGWIIKYTDGLTDDAAGPCQGPQGVHGEQGPASTVPGPEGTAKPGDYACPDGEHMTGFAVADDGAVTLACQAPNPPVIDPPSPGDRP
jgi:hypothetical protein